ncbi:MAG TPA: hypothetical protein PL087_03630 [Bacteroidales bacterium]|nr:hypothetical protein [Bacteroidales bacterium]
MKKTKRSPRKSKETGKKLIDHANRAIRQEFYLEAALILSDVFEKRIRYLLVRSGQPKTTTGNSLEHAVKRLKYVHLTHQLPELNAHLPVVLIDAIRGWKNQRNNILKDLMDIHVSETRLKSLAVNGMTLLKEFNQSVKKVKSALKTEPEPNPSE